MFNPQEIIFCPTAECNLHCPHCFVKQDKITLNTQKSLTFLENSVPNIQKVGFSGGEPFLNPDFLLAVIKKTVQLDLLFDQIMTNGTLIHLLIFFHFLFNFLEADDLCL